DGLVGDDEDAALALRMRHRRRDARGRLVASTDEGPIQNADAEYDEDGDAEPGVDDRGDDDQGEVTDRQEQEPERVGFAAKRIPHVLLFSPLLEDVNRGVDDDPHDVDEMPVDTAQLDAVVLRRREVAAE